MPAIIPPLKFKAVDDTGAPLVGGLLYSYAAGTSTPKATYTSYTLGASNANPVVLDSNGEADVWLSGAYKFVLKDSLGVTVYTVDDVRDITSSGSFADPTISGAPTISSTTITWSGNPTHSGNHTFTNNVTINGNTTLGDSSSDSLTVKPNAVTWTNNPTHSGNHTFSGDVAVNGNSTLGDAAGDTATVNATTTFPLAVTPHTFGLKVGNTSRADGETLDWYKEDTFTPTLSFGGGSTGLTYSLNSGNYTRIGNRVHFDLGIYVSNKGSSTGTAVISGLPVSAAAYEYINVVYGGMASLSGPLVVQTNQSATTLSIAHVTTASTGQTTLLTDANFTNSSAILLTGCYRV